MRRGSTAAVGLALGIGALGLAGCEEPAQPASTLTRPTEAVTLTGARLPNVHGASPSRVVGFRREGAGDAARWVQVPVQVDQRKVVDFGTAPSSNSSPGTTGTVYGQGTSGVTALQYADPGTWVGADGDSTFDGNDELTFMAADAGGRAPASTPRPSGTIGAADRVEVRDPREAGTGWVYLFRSDGSLVPSAGQDYVTYQFAPTAGPYKTTYRRASGPNPETSTVTTANYEIGFQDRWEEVTWKVRAGSASGVDLLDGHKNQFAVDECGRSNATFDDEEGAFVANLDGPVRAIRSYVGANSGPLTQRTHYFYKAREETVTDLRVHPIPEIMDFVDLSPAATGSIYRSSTQLAGVKVDGVQDAVSTAPPRWEAINGAGGRLYLRSTFSTTATDLQSHTKAFYRDQAHPTEAQCWGDDSYYGAAGTDVQTGIPNTDPRYGAAAVVKGTRVTQFGAPAADPSKIKTYAADWAADVDRRLTTTVSGFSPSA